MPSYFFPCYWLQRVFFTMHRERPQARVQPVFTLPQKALGEPNPYDTEALTELREIASEMALWASTQHP